MAQNVTGEAIKDLWTVASQKLQEQMSKYNCFDL